MGVLKLRALLAFPDDLTLRVKVVNLQVAQGELGPLLGAAGVAVFVNELARRHVGGIVLHPDLPVVKPELTVAEEKVGEVGGGGHSKWLACQS